MFYPGNVKVSTTLLGNGKNRIQGYFLNIMHGIGNYKPTNLIRTK